MGSNLNGGLGEDIGDLVAELPEPFRSLAALWVLGTFFLAGAHGAIPLLKRANVALPWPLNWLDAIKSNNWAGLGWTVLVAGTMGAVGYVVWWRWGPRAMERRKAARRRLVEKYR